MKLIGAIYIQCRSMSNLSFYVICDSYDIYDIHDIFDIYDI